MINLLRKIRRTEFKGRYLKYAFGEILLVVIGILIALSINNWNEERKAAKKEAFYYEQLLEDALADSAFYQSRQVGLSESLNAYNSLLSAAEGTPLDTSTFSLDRLFMIYAYESQLMQNHPDAVDLVSDRQIQRSLLRYSNKYEYVKKGVTVNNRIVEDRYIPFYIQHGKKMGSTDRIPLLLNYDYLFEQTEFWGLIDMLRGFTQNALIQVDTMVVVNQELIQHLKQKLD